MTKAERAELRSIIKARFKVLRADVVARQAELHAEVEQRLNAKHAAGDKLWSDTVYLISQAADEANRKANDILRASGLVEDYPTRSDYRIVNASPVAKPKDDRMRVLHESAARIEAQVRAAYVELDRQEASLLTELLIGALESDEAQAFLNKIPTVSALVPADRIMALVGTIESSSDDD